MISSGELIIIFLIAFLVFGPDKLPELAKTLGKWLYEIRKGMHNATAEIENEIHKTDMKQENDDNILTEEKTNSTKKPDPKNAKKE